MTFLPDNFKDKNICVLGLGYVGLTLATTMADAGFNIQGVEIKDEILDKHREGTPHFYEPGLSNKLKSVIRRNKFKCSKYIPENNNVSVYIITVGTPLDNDGKVCLDMIRNVATEIKGHIKDGDLIIMRSTVRLGTTRNIVMPILNEANVRFDIAFCPERTIEGNALQELRALPQIVGGLNLGSTVRAGQIFQFLTPTVVKVSDIETAETIKMVDNTYRDITFGFANEVARICDAVGASAQEVISAGKLGYSRVNIPMPGPVGGPCLEKDPYILAEGLKKEGIIPEIAMAARRTNERQAKDVIKMLHDLLSVSDRWPKCPKIALMGIAFKGRPVTNDLRGTMAKPIFEMVQRFFPNAEYRGFDAVVGNSEIEKFGLRPYSSIKSVTKDANLVLILNNHSIFSELNIENLSYQLSKPSLVYDFWNNFKASDLNLSEGTGYMALGSHKKAILP